MLAQRQSVSVIVRYVSDGLLFSPIIPVEKSTQKTFSESSADLKLYSVPFESEIFIFHIKN